MKVVPIREGSPPPLTAIAERLRWMAGEIEKGDKGEVGEPYSCIVLLLDDEGGIVGFSYGEPLTVFEQVGALNMAATHAAMSGLEE